MKQTILSCDLCKETASDLTCRLFGVNYTDGNIDSLTRPPESCSVHICAYCLDELTKTVTREGVLK